MSEDGTEQPVKRRKRSHDKKDPLSVFKDNLLLTTFAIVVIMIVLILSLPTHQGIAKIFGLLGARPLLTVKIYLDRKGNPILKWQNEGSQKLISVRTQVHSFSFPSNETDPANYVGPDSAGQKLSFGISEMKAGTQATAPIVGLIDSRVVYVVRSTFFRENNKAELGQEDIFLWNRAKRQILDPAQLKNDPDYPDMIRSIKSHWGRIPAPPGEIRP
jgi:hypothetical protein